MFWMGRIIDTLFIIRINLYLFLQLLLRQNSILISIGALTSLKSAVLYQ